MMKRIIIILLILAAVVGVTAYLNKGAEEDLLTAQRESIIFISEEGERIAEVSYSDLEQLEEAEFSATLRSSSQPAREVSYTGVTLRDILAAAGTDPVEYEGVNAAAVDGYTVALDIDEVLMEDNVFVVYLRDGEPLETRDQGGDGPYQLIVREDTYGQRWVKYLMEIDLR